MNERTDEKVVKHCISTVRSVYKSRVCTWFPGVSSAPNTVSSHNRVSILAEKMNDSSIQKPMYLNEDFKSGLSFSDDLRPEGRLQSKPWTLIEKLLYIPLGNTHSFPGEFGIFI